MAVSSDSLSFRAATPSDADALAQAMVEGVEDYRSFAPPAWRPPSPLTVAEHLRGRLGDEDVWCLVAEADGQLVGHIILSPAARSAHPLDEPTLGHVGNLFVRRDFWGSGLAKTLHDAAVEVARERGFTEMRLFVAAGQARARRFYEREGWQPASEEFYDPAPGLVMVEYRYSLRSSLRP